MITMGAPRYRGCLLVGEVMSSLSMRVSRTASSALQEASLANTAKNPGKTREGSSRSISQYCPLRVHGKKRKKWTRHDGKPCRSRFSRCMCAINTSHYVCKYSQIRSIATTYVSTVKFGVYARPPPPPFTAFVPTQGWTFTPNSYTNLE